MDVAEFVGDMGHRVHELRELGGQGEVAAVAHAADRRAQDRAAGLAPVVEAFDARIVALVERVGEEVRQEAAFGVPDARNIGDHAGGGAVADGSDHGVQAKLVESILVRFGADPLVAEEHHRLFAGGVGHVGELLDVFAHEAGEEVDPVALGLSGHTPGGVVGAAVHEVLRTQAVAVLGFEIIQRTRAYGAGATEPVDDLFAALLIEQERELVEERGESHHIGLRAVLKPLLERVEHELAGGRMIDVERDLVFLVAPVVGQMVVHLDRVPDDVGQEAHRVFVHRHGRGHVHGVLARVERPAGRVHDLTRGAVHDFPVLVRVGVAVRLELFLEEAVHQRHVHRVGFSQDTGGQQVDLRGLVHVQGDPLVVGAGREVGAVDLLAESEHCLVQMRAVGVADGVRTPQFGEFLGLFGEIFFTGQREAAGAGHECSFALRFSKHVATTCRTVMADVIVDSEDLTAYVLDAHDDAGRLGYTPLGSWRECRPAWRQWMTCRKDGTIGSGREIRCAVPALPKRRPAFTTKRPDTSRPQSGSPVLRASAARSPCDVIRLLLRSEPTLHRDG